MNRGRNSIDEIAIGAVVWVYARGAWRNSRVVATARTRLTVTYVVHSGLPGGTLRCSVVAPAMVRRESPGRGRVVATPAPPTSIDQRGR